MADGPIYNDSIYIAFDATLEEFVDVHMRQVWRSREWQHRLRSMIAAGVVGSALATVVVDGLIGRPVGSEMVVAGVLGGFAGSMCGPLYGRIFEWGVRHTLLEKYGARVPMRCEIELRPTCLWVRQDGVEIVLAWTTARAVEDTLDRLSFRIV
jgi:hypothetical protein